MILFWSIAAAFVVAALLFLLPPLVRRRTTAPDVRVAANAAIYREQLDELAVELQRGAVTREEFERASREVEHRIVAEHAGGAPAPAVHRPAVVAALVVGLLLPLAAVVGYLQLGSPGALDGAAKGATHEVSPEQMESLVERLAAKLEQTPNDAEGWMLLGRSLAVLQKYDRAAQAYARASQLAPNDAGLLADYADTLAMAQGRRLAGEPLAIVKRALAIDPVHVKSLALAGSAEFENRNYTGAIGYWEQILKIEPADSEFARMVTNSIAEARTLAGGAAAKKGPAQAAKEKPPQAVDKSLQGVVSIDPALASKLSPGDTVFVLARPVSGPRMPLAVARTTVAALPYRFKLDDSMAMAPGMTISSHAKVVIAARVSKSGNAISQKGDIEGTSEPVVPGTSGMKVVISRVIE
jgi:cytochrome c-type biogenesis protein CcmH